jgi:hypothetical protein
MARNLLDDGERHIGIAHVGQRCPPKGMGASASDSHPLAGLLKIKSAIARVRGFTPVRPGNNRPEG